MNLSELSPVSILAIVFTALVLRYALFAGAAYGIVWRYFGEKFASFRIQPAKPRAGKIQSEIKNSVISLFIFALVGLSVVLAKRAGYTMIYHDISAFGWLYFYLSIPLAILMHDAYFYWTHRLMHTKLLYRHVHAVHHQSTNPSPWAAFSFHPFEAVIEASIVPIIAFTIPIHPAALLSFLLFMTTLNVVGHLGYEFYPTRFVHDRRFSWNNTSTHHNMHHQKNNCNYGLYFNWWDKLFNTNHHNYRTYFDETVRKRVKRESLQSTAS